MIITKTINADLWVRERPQEIPAVQGDTATRKIAVKLFANREPWIPGEGVSVAVRYRKPDGTGGSYDTMPNGEKAWELTGNTVSFLLAPQMLAIPGRVEAQVEILSGNSVIASFGFCVLVEENVAAGATRSHNYFNWVQRLETKLKEKLKEAKESGVFDGPVGATPDLQIGAVTTLPAGSAAAAAFRGTAEVPILDLGLPKGADAQMDATLTLSGRAADAAAVGKALAGKAPAGCGFGEELLVGGRTVLAAEDTSLESYCAIIDSMLTSMANYTARLVLARAGRWNGNFYQNSGNCQAILYRGADETSASLVTVGAAYDWRMRKTGGVWQEPEWVDPPMLAGVEYRTTERYEGKPVYAKLIHYGAMPAAATATIPHNISGAARFVSCDAMFFHPNNGNGSITMPRYYADTNRQFAAVVSGNIEVHSAVDVSSYTCYVMVKYTKSSD